MPAGVLIEGSRNNEISGKYRREATRKKDKVAKPPYKLGVTEKICIFY